MYHVFATVGAFTGGKVIPSCSSAPLVFSSLVIKKANKQRVLLANHTPLIQVISVPALGQKAALHHLDETNAEQAMGEPESFLNRAGKEVFPSEGLFKIELLPYAFAWLDF